MPTCIDNVAANWRGVDALRFVRNGQVANAGLMLNVARGLNHLLAMHGTRIPGMSVLPATSLHPAQDTRLWTTYYRATPNGTTLLSRVVLLPSLVPGAGTIVPRWRVDVDGATGTTQQHDRVNGALTLGDLFHRDQEITVTANALHRLDLYVQDECRVCGWHLWERDRGSLSSAADTMANFADVIAGRGIFDATLQSYYTALWAAWKNVRGCHLSWNVPNPASPIASTETSTNIWDATTSRTASTVGVRCPTANRGSYISTTIPVKAWALMERTAGADDIHCYFATASGGIDVTCAGALDIFTATGTIDVAAAGDKVDVLFNADTGNTGNLYACGLFPLVA